MNIDVGISDFLNGISMPSSVIVVDDTRQSHFKDLLQNSNLEEGALPKDLPQPSQAPVNVSSDQTLSFSTVHPSVATQDLFPVADEQVNLLNSNDNFQVTLQEPLDERELVTVLTREIKEKPDLEKTETDNLSNLNALYSLMILNQPSQLPAITSQKELVVEFDSQNSKEKEFAENRDTVLVNDLMNNATREGNRNVPTQSEIEFISRMESRTLNPYSHDAKEGSLNESLIVNNAVPKESQRTKPIWDRNLVNQIETPNRDLSSVADKQVPISWSPKEDYLVPSYDLMTSSIPEYSVSKKVQSPLQEHEQLVDNLAPSTEILDYPVSQDDIKTKILSNFDDLNMREADKVERQQSKEPSVLVSGRLKDDSSLPKQPMFISTPQELSAINKIEPSLRQIEPALVKESTMPAEVEIDAKLRRNDTTTETMTDVGVDNKRVPTTRETDRPIDRPIERTIGIPKSFELNPLSLSEDSLVTKKLTPERIDAKEIEKLSQSNDMRPVVDNDLTFDKEPGFRENLGFNLRSLVNSTPDMRDKESDKSFSVDRQQPFMSNVIKLESMTAMGTEVHSPYETIMTNLAAYFNKNLASSDMSLKPSQLGNDLTPGIENKSTINSFLYMPGNLASSLKVEGYTAKIKVYPPDLGQITAEILINKGMAELTLSADSSQVRHFIESNLQPLRDSFQNANIQLNDVLMQQSSSSDRQELPQHKNSGFEGSEYHQDDRQDESFRQPEHRQSKSIIDTYA
jgi:flagellar hook-length control protein FliK